ncbi:LOW QUALITY PROTEIN: E3 ubiquitin-protein ligase RBBP6-like [Mycteria americana]|uniref:LOW QUALITY PROTEIN: E3 ubiquitin-protein ligase RBBP6-like n=1 Tax=Mycteria americana TaxID=33587 RepID=UPI003F586174
MLKSSNRGRPRSEHTQRPQAPTLASTAAFVPVPPPPLSPPPPHALPLPPGVPAPQFPPQFAPGQPPSAGYTVPPPAYPPAPAHTSSAWVPTAVPMAHSHTIPTTHAPPLCRQEFYREQRRLEEEKEGKRNSKPDEFTADFAKEMTECKRMKKEHRRSFSSDIVKFGILSSPLLTHITAGDLDPAPGRSRSCPAGPGRDWLNVKTQLTPGQRAGIAGWGLHAEIPELALHQLPRLLNPLYGLVQRCLDLIQQKPLPTGFLYPPIVQVQNYLTNHQHTALPVTNHSQIDVRP